MAKVTMFSSMTSAPPGSRTGSSGRLAPFAAGAAGIALVLVAYYAWTWRSLTRTIDAFTGLFSDFILYYYPMGEVIFRTRFPVDGFLYSPLAAIVFAVFPPIGLATSLILWGIVQVAFVVFYLLLFRRLVPARLPIQLLFVALTVSSYPLVLNFMAGSVNVFMIVGLLGLLVLNESGRRVLAAGLFVFAVSFKLYPILFAAPFAVGRNRRFFVVAAAASVVAFLIVPGILLGPGGTLGFYQGLADQFRGSGWVTANPHSQFFPHLAARLAAGAGYDGRTLLPLLYWVTFGVAAANLGLIFLVQRANLRGADLWSFQVVFLTIPFVLKTAWPHDFVFLGFTQALLVWWLREGKGAVPGYDDGGFRPPDGPRRRRHAGAVSAVVVFLVVSSIVLSNIFFFTVFGNFSGYGYCGFLFWSDLALLIAVYMELLPPALRELRSRSRRGAGTSSQENDFADLHPGLTPPGTAC